MKTRNALQYARYLVILLLLIIELAQPAFARCTVQTSAHQPAEQTHDPFGILFSSPNKCPQDVFALRQLLQSSGLTLETTLVANRGFHNPSQGSFSLFEMASGMLQSTDTHLLVNSGDVFFGHFTAVNAEDVLIADQNTGKGSLMIEAFAWDPEKELFNFYELRGEGQQGQWFYRGDSADIFADNQLLHRQPDVSAPQFGTRLRCSGCHGSGGPIMKELSAPYNDWWQAERGLDFGGRKMDESLQELLKTLVPADHLAKSVVAGVKKLNQSKFFQHDTSLSLQEQLRPLFCPVEVNFMSDSVPNEKQHPEIKVPSQFFVDSRMLAISTPRDVTISRPHYKAALIGMGSMFPETSLSDADHAWLTPVKAISDQLAVERLIKKGIIKRKFMFDVLDVDRENPVFSSVRCTLLPLIPEQETPDWDRVFLKNLQSSQNPGAKALIANLINPEHDVAFYKEKTAAFLAQCQLKLRDIEQVNMMYRLLAQRRMELRASEISKNPLGQILEPGFRVIFPENEPVSFPGELKLTSTCEVVASER